MIQDRSVKAVEATILIVDDEPTVCQLLAESVADRPWRVEAVHSAAEALALCAKTPVDVVILDKNLPDMSGVKLFWQLRHEGHQVACIMITGYASAESAIEMLNLGVSAYLEKPFEDLFAVGDKIAEVLRRHREESPRAARLRRARHPARSGGRERPRLTVLLASPDAEVRRGMQASFAGDALLEAPTMPALEEALAAGRSIDLIILHASLSPTTSSALAAAVRTRAPAAPLVVLSRRPPVTILKQLIELEVDVLVEEPFDAGTFASAVASLVAHVRQGRQMIGSDPRSATQLLPEGRP